jgi:hypothetical protein
MTYPFDEVLSMVLNGFLNRIWRRIIILTIGITLLLSSATVSPAIAAVDQDVDQDRVNIAFINKEAGSIREEAYAYTLGVQAFIYAFPWTYNPQAYWNQLTSADGTVNQFMHDRELKDADYDMGGSYNNDTLYSQAVLYLGNEPIIISVPALKDRYYTMEMVDFRGDNFAYVGRRATGTAAGNYAIIGPGWEGELPDDVQQIEGPSVTPWAFIGGRTLVTEEEKRTGDLGEIHKIQDQYTLTPLSQWLDPNAPPPDVPDLWQPYPSTDPLADWKNINRAMADNPPVPNDPEMFALFAEIGIGPGLDVEAQSASTKRGLERAAITGLKILKNPDVVSSIQNQVNGWSYPPPEIGRFSATEDWLPRAIVMEGGFYANDPEEGVYLNASVDSVGDVMTGDNRYELRFEADQLPQVNDGGFWSVTMYSRGDNNLVDNVIDRYSLGDRSGMTIAEDNSLTIYIEKDKPDGCVRDDTCANWLPAPEGNFYMVLRTYLPQDPIIDQSWEPPGVMNRGAAQAH